MGVPTDPSTFWDERAAAWAEHADGMELFARQFGDPAIELLDPAPGQHLVDVGCGPGISSIDLARRVGATGSVLGVDVSAAMVAAAEARAAESDVANVRFEVADPGVGPIGSFDGLYSRFGVMFFDDPRTALENLRRSIGSGGRFVAVVWAELEANPWMFIPTMFGAGPLDADLALPGPDEPGPFSLADLEPAVRLLEAAGFVELDVDRVEHHWTFDAATWTESITQLLAVGALGEAWADADHEARTAAVEAVRAGCEDHREGDVWRLPAAALVYSARVRS